MTARARKVYAATATWTMNPPCCRSPGPIIVGGNCSMAGVMHLFPQIVADNVQNFVMIYLIFYKVA